MKSEVLEKKLLEINNVLIDNIRKFPYMHGKIHIILTFIDGGIEKDFEVNVEQKKRFN